MTQTVPDISPLMPMHQDPLLVMLFESLNLTWRPVMATRWSYVPYRLACTLNLKQQFNMYDINLTFSLRSFPCPRSLSPPRSRSPLSPRPRWGSGRSERRSDGWRRGSRFLLTIGEAFFGGSRWRPAGRPPRMLGPGLERCYNVTYKLCYSTNFHQFIMFMQVWQCNRQYRSDNPQQ